MRWFTLVASFLAVIFLSFAIFLWTWRCELIARAFDLSLKETKTTIESVTTNSLHFVTLKAINIQEENKDALQIDQVLLEIRLSDFLSWACLPIRSPLVIKKATATFHNDIALSAIPEQGNNLFIQNLEIVLPNGTTEVLGEEKGSIGQILIDALKSMKPDKSTQP